MTTKTSTAALQEARLPLEGGEVQPGRRIGTYRDLAAMIRAAPARCGTVRLVAIDGPGGAGKSVLAERLADHLGRVPVLHTDDFASWDEPIHWWPRLEDDVLGPLERGDRVRYQAYDWAARQLSDWRELPASDVVVLEGVSSARRAVADRLSLAIWVETPRAVRLARGIDRDGEEMRGQWDAWMAEEDAHYAADRTTERADVIVDGAPTLPHDAAMAFVRLR